MYIIGTLGDPCCKMELVKYQQGILSSKTNIKGLNIQFTSIELVTKCNILYDVPILFLVDE